MANIKALADELRNDPLSRGYSSMTDQEAADDLNTAYRTQYRDVPVGELVGVVELRGIYEKLEAASSSEAAKLLRLASNQSPITSLGYGDPTQRQQIDNLLDKLVDDGVIDSADRDELQALGTAPATRARELHLLGLSREISAAHVSKARS